MWVHSFQCGRVDGNVSGAYNFGKKTEKVEWPAGGDRWALAGFDAVAVSRCGAGNGSDYRQFQ